ncbi:MAG TPA: hypothetical protein VFJ94_16360 [Intrasporangium sp.]|uniref:hypothetical protein n=1 Tax=Intrasporangium sp. TaxID=1925024 RepID=UPI002D792DAD|nr:hypothetical protein [Intrasporangium sp.]HET7400089.1 hypothetical protein [Intrasporangium sp.]
MSDTTPGSTPGTTPGTTADATEATARALAQRFVRDEAGFAQLTTLDARGYPVTRTMTAFLLDEWSVATVQRRGHRRIEQWRRRPQTEVTWVGSPRPGATNERPHVFDLGRLPPRVVAVRGEAVLMPPGWTEQVYRAAVTAQRARGNTRAPLRSPEEVAADLVGVLIRPVRVRLEGFGDGAQSFTFVP